MATDAKNPEHWFDFASDDLIRACRRFAEGDYVDCLFHLQQSAEKALKGKLIASGWKLQRTHDLSALIVALKTRGTDCSWYESVASVLATEYIADRYPGFNDAPPEPDEVRTFVRETTKLFENLTGRKYSGPPLSA
ncbi:MAG: HEPN domain-containing protein [Verrucomicrobia bacterium]|nr:HEPN domain-containing protein [Verrucomicrobiota bacterium]